MADLGCKLRLGPRSSAGRSPTKMLAFSGNKKAMLDYWIISLALKEKDDKFLGAGLLTTLARR